MHNLTPVSGLLGGALIGLASVLLMLLNGRITGVAGIVGRLVAPSADDRGWRVAFVAGLIAAALLAALGGAPLLPAMPARLTVIVAAGLLVGIGTRMKRPSEGAATSSNDG
jgi:uncharacterized protein